jgi:hypothetical protein
MTVKYVHTFETYANLTSGKETKCKHNQDTTIKKASLCRTMIEGEG